MDINADLITRTINGDEIAFKKIYSKISGKVYAICLRYAKNITEANFYFEESYLNIYKNLKRYNYREVFENWADEETVNTCLFLIKKNVFFKPLAIGLNMDENNIEFDNKIETGLSFENQLIIALQNISVGYRTILNLYYIEQYGLSKIGKLFGISLAECKLRLKTANTLFKQQLPNIILDEMLNRRASPNSGR